MQQNRLTHIDGLRGLAALVVMVSHFLCTFYPAFQTIDAVDVQTRSGIELFIAATPFNFWYNGNFAVCIFFVISGYVLSYSYFKTGDTEYIYSSAFRRYFRLIIPVLFTSVLFFAFMKWNLFPTTETAAVTHSKWLAGKFSFTPDWFQMVWDSTIELVIKYGAETPYNPVLWTIGHEIRGSFLVYFLLFILGKNNYRWIGYLLFFIVLIKSYYILFIAGIMLCDLHVKGQLPKAPVLVKILLLALAIWCGSYRQLPEPATWHLLDPLCSFIKPSTIGAILLFYVFITSSGAEKIFSTRIFKFLGDISYMLYLIHLLVICSVACYLFMWFTQSMQVSYHIAFWITFLLSSGVILLLSKVLFEGLDKTGIRFSKGFYKWLFR
jgi:peptidoglycan/LPS O-acetylase OafA/YrhL